MGYEKHMPSWTAMVQVMARVRAAGLDEWMLRLSAPESVHAAHKKPKQSTRGLRVDTQAERKPVETTPWREED